MIHSRAILSSTLAQPTLVTKHPTTEPSSTLTQRKHTLKQTSSAEEASLPLSKLRTPNAPGKDWYLAEFVLHGNLYFI